MPEAPPPLRLALLGCGAIAPMHLGAARFAADRVTITAAIDRDPDRASAVANGVGATPFASLDEALAAGGFDAVAVLLPPALHEEATVTCLEAGQHVLLEKPMAPTVEACERILAAAAATDRVLMVAENSQYWPEVVTARRLIAEGAIGEVVTARATAFFSVGLTPQFYEGDDHWRYDAGASGGGVTLDVGSHWIRPLRMLLGELDEVVAALDHPLQRMEGESLARALLRFRSGRCASLEVLASDGLLTLESLFRVTGTEGEIVIDGEDGGRTVLFNADRYGESEPIEGPVGYLESYGPQLLDFARACAGEKALEAGPGEAVGELRTARAIARSAGSGRWEKVWDDGASGAGAGAGVAGVAGVEERA